MSSAENFTQSTRHLSPILISASFRNSEQSSRKPIRRIFTPIFAFVRVKFPSEDSHLRSIATGRPNWTSKTYRRLPKFLLSVETDTWDVQKLSKSPPTFNELYDVCPAYLLEIRYLCWLSFKDVPLSACGSFIDIGVKCRGTLLMAAWSLCVFVTRAELINWCLYNLTFFCENTRWNNMKSLLFLNIHVLKS